MLIDKNNNLTLKENFGEDIAHELSASPILQSIIKTSPVAFNVWTKDMINIMCNNQVLNIFNIESGSEYLDNFYKFSPKFQPNGISSEQMADINFKKAVKEGTNVFNWMHQTLDEQMIPCEISITNADNGYFIVFVRDLRSDFHAMDNSNYNYYFTDKIPHNVMLQEISDLADEWFFSLDIRTGNFRYFGKIWFNGFDDDMLISEDRIIETGFIHNDDINIFKEMQANFKLGSNNTYDIRFLNDKKEFRYFRLAYKSIFDDNKNPIFIIGKATDIHEQKLLELQSQHDMLTNSYSGEFGGSVISELLKSSRDERHAIFLIDIDNFKNINDNFGHLFGDEILREVVQKLRNIFSEDDVIVRVGGDEFIVFVQNIAKTEDVDKIAGKILNTYRDLYPANFKEHAVSASIGVSVYPKDGRTFETLYLNADLALNLAKTAGKNRYEKYSSDIIYSSDRNRTSIDNAEKIAASYFDYEFISNVFNILYDKNGDSNSIDTVLQFLCQKYDADRSYIFESLDGGESYNNTFEFCKDGISSEIEGLQNVPKENFVDFLEKAHNDIIYSNNLRDTFENEEAFVIMANQGILSFVHAQVKRDGIMTFFIGLDDCTKTRAWTEQEINSLQYIGKILSIILQGTHLREEVDKLAESYKNSSFILNTSEDIVYVSDIDTYELLYLNQSIKNLIGITSDDQFIGQKCYKILQGKDAPCEFCTNKLLSLDDFYEWSYYNPMLQKSFLLKDRLIPFEGRPARLEIATDVTKIIALESELEERLIDEQFISSCVELLHSGKDPDLSISMLLESVANYYDADRSYIFEISEDGKFISNTYEYTKENSNELKDKMQDIPKDVLAYVFDRFKKENAFYQSMENISAQNNQDKQRLMDIHKLASVLMGSIFVENGEVTGFVGVDNPKTNVLKTETISSVAKFIASFLDQTKLITTLNKLSYHDTLTGSKNRHSYNRTLKQINNKAIESLGVVYVDITKLRAINDAKGVLYGDKIIIRLSGILKKLFGEDVYRVGGDEFVVLKENVTENDFENSISMLKQTLSAESEFNASVGYTWNKNFNINSDELNNLYAGEKYSRILETNLDMEIADDKFVVYLQPQVTLATGKVESAEALIRRYDANGILQPPSVFIPFYEKEGIISNIDVFVLETVCKTLKSWKDLGVESIESIAVNCSRMTIAEKGIVSKFSEICDKYGIEHSKIVVEITETINGISESVLSQIINDFRDANFLISLDDFGCGYSNLTSLIASEFDEVKIDMRIINGVESDEKSRALAEVAITLCNKLNNITSVAEGVEDSIQMSILNDLGCIKGQGYFFDRPMIINDFADKYIFGDYSFS